MRLSKEYRIRRAARAGTLLAVVQPERHGGDVVAGLLEKQGRNRRVDATAHRGHDALAAGSAASLFREEHLIRLAIPVILERLV